MAEKYDVKHYPINQSINQIQDNQVCLKHNLMDIKIFEASNVKLILRNLEYFL